MTFTKNTLYAAMLSAMVGVVGCSSDSSDTNNTKDANVTGRITGFGSVYVDGVEYETIGTSITIDGEPATEDDLRVGMIVNITGSDDGRNGEAINITFEDEVEGVVTQTVAGGGLEVMGLAITTDGTTNLELTGLTDTNADGVIDLADLVAGDEVEISGYPDGQGGVHATYVEYEGAHNGSDEIEVKGIIAGLTADSFTIGNMTVSFSVDTVFSDGLTSAADLANGLYVEVKSTTAPDPVTGLTATKIELEDGGHYGVDGDEGEDLELEGKISELTETTITVNGQTFDIPEGLDLSGFAVGDMIDLDLKVVNGEVVIHEVEDESHDDDVPGKIEVEAVVSATDTTVGSSSITLGGITISVDPAKVIMLDYSATANHALNLGSLVEGVDRVEVEAIPNTAGDGYIAISIEREASSDNTSIDQYVEIEGPVTIDGTSGAYSIAGVTVDMTSATFDDLNTIADVVANAEISVKGSLNDNGVLVATKVEID